MNAVNACSIEFNPKTKNLELHLNSTCLYDRLLD